MQTQMAFGIRASPIQTMAITGGVTRCNWIIGGGYLVCDLRLYINYSIQPGVEIPHEMPLRSYFSTTPKLAHVKELQAHYALQLNCKRECKSLASIDICDSIESSQEEISQRSKCIWGRGLWALIDLLEGTFVESRKYSAFLSFIKTSNGTQCFVSCVRLRLCYCLLSRMRMRKYRKCSADEWTGKIDRFKWTLCNWLKLIVIHPRHTVVIFESLLDELCARHTNRHAPRNDHAKGSKLFLARARVSPLTRLSLNHSFTSQQASPFNSPSNLVKCTYKWIHSSRGSCLLAPVACSATAPNGTFHCSCRPF